MTIHNLPTPANRRAAVSPPDPFPAARDVLLLWRTHPRAVVDSAAEILGESEWHEDKTLLARVGCERAAGLGLAVVPVHDFTSRLPKLAHVDGDRVTVNGEPMSLAEFDARWPAPVPDQWGWVDDDNHGARMLGWVMVAAIIFWLLLGASFVVVQAMKFMGVWQ